MRKSSPTRHAEWKVCKRITCAKAGTLQPKANFGNLRGGGTSDVCNECKRLANRDAELRRNGKDRQLFLERQQKHFDAELRKAQERWDSLPDGHPYKAPRRPGSSN